MKSTTTLPVRSADNLEFHRSSNRRSQLRPCLLVDGMLHKNLTEEKINELVKTLE
jgi:hypothetical protein